MRSFELPSSRGNDEERDMNARMILEEYENSNPVTKFNPIHKLRQSGSRLFSLRFPPAANFRLLLFE